MTDWAWVGIGLAGAIVLVGTVLLVLRLRQVRIVGPMFWYELVKLARRGQQPRLRALLVGLLLVGLFITYLREFRGVEMQALFGGMQLPTNRTAQFGETFLITFSVAQLAAVILMTPVIVGSAISEEKERGTLDYLRSTLLSNREIILGKLTARLAFLFGIVLAGVPVLALTFLFGGVDFRVLTGSYIITATTAISLGAFSLLLGVIREGLKEVLVWTYGIMLALSLPGLCCGCIPGLASISPVSAMLYLFVGPSTDPSAPPFWINIGAFAALQGAVAIVCTYFAIRRVRTAPPVHRRAPVRAVRQRRWHEEEPLPIARRATEDAEGTEAKWRYFEPDDEDDRYEVREPRARRRFSVRSLRADADPFLWKERYFVGQMAMAEGGFLSGCGITLVSGVIFALGLIVFISTARELDSGMWTGEAVNGPLRIFVVGSVLVLGLAVGSRAAASIARERQRQTIDALLVLPVARLQILRAKALAPLIWARYGILALIVALIAGLVTMGVHPLGFVAAVVQASGSIFLTVIVAVWLSVRCQTVARATVFFILWTLVFWLGPVVVAPLAAVLVDQAGSPELGDTVSESIMHLSPPVGIWNGLFAWNEFTGIRDPKLLITVGVGLAAGVLYAILGLILMADAVRTFEREGK